MNNGFVVDNSVVMGWCFEDEASDYTDAVQNQLTDKSAIVPSIWPLEVANVLMVAERKNRIGKAHSGHFLFLLSQLPINVEPAKPETVFRDVFYLAREYRLSSYNASYLELAIRRGLPIASLDKAIIRVAKDLKILFKPDLQME